MTVKELKQYIENVDERLDNREVVLNGFGGGYNPIEHIDVAKTLVKYTSPNEPKEHDNKYVVVLSIG